ncbi:MAG: protein kinase [Acidobacteria bacterium]|nr:protein kinase [Acidobacteriota bacterium]
MKYCKLCGSVRLEEDPQTLPENFERNAFDSSKLIGCILANKYRIEERVATGAMGAVFRAKHTFIDNDLAVKILHPNLVSDHIVLERFIREARTLALIDHPNTIKVIDFGHIENLYYLVMEFIKGISLRTYLERQHTLSVTETVKIIGQVCAAVDAAHKCQIIHRDLKPENIMLKQDRDKELVVKVVDFGVAKEQSIEGQNRSLTVVGTIIGTPYYMAPEQGMTGDVDLRSDVYSLGAITFEALTGERVFDAPLAMSVIVKKITEAPRSMQSINPEIPKDVDRVVLRALEKDPANRFSSAHEFAVELAMAAFKNSPATYQVTTAKLALPKQQLTTMLKREANSDDHTQNSQTSNEENVLERNLTSREEDKNNFQKISSSIMDSTIETPSPIKSEVWLKVPSTESPNLPTKVTEKLPKLLVVINSPTIILVISKHMKKVGFDVHAISNSQSAMNVILTEELSVIILGLDLPGLSGEDLCKMIKTDPKLKASSHIPVLLFSSLDEEQLAEKVKHCQADGYIHKAWKMDKVATVINQTIKESEKALAK